MAHPASFVVGPDDRPHLPTSVAASVRHSMGDERPETRLGPPSWSPTRWEREHQMTRQCVLRPLCPATP